MKLTIYSLENGINLLETLHLNGYTNRHGASIELVMSDFKKMYREHHIVKGKHIETYFIEILKDKDGTSSYNLCCRYDDILEIRKCKIQKILKNHRNNNNS